MGPGSHLKQLFESVGIYPKPGCRCLHIMQKMNNWGPAECRRRIMWIVTALEDDAVLYGWGDHLAARLRASLSGLALHVNWMNPYYDLVIIAIAKSEDTSSGESQT